jgi:hypothetical protein
MATMELTDSEVGIIARTRQTPEERKADDADRRAAQEAAMLNRMGLADRDAYNARKAAVAALTPNQRVAYTYLTVRERAEDALARPDVAAEVAAVKAVIDALRPKPILEAKPDNLLRAPAKKGR